MQQFSSSLFPDKSGVDVTVWSGSTFEVQYTISSPLDVMVYSAVYLADQQVVILGCLGGAICLWSIGSQTIEQIAKASSAVVSMAVCSHLGSLLLGQTHGLISELSISRHELTEFVMLKDVIKGVVGYRDDKVLVVTNCDAVGIDMRERAFAFWNTFAGPSVNEVRFSNNMKYVAIDRGSAIELYVIRDMFDYLKF